MLKIKTIKKILNKKIEKHPEFEPTTPWLVTIINKIFDEDTNNKEQENVK